MITSDARVKSLLAHVVLKGIDSFVWINSTSPKTDVQVSSFYGRPPFGIWVVEQGSPEKGYLLRIEPEGKLDTRALLSGREAAAFFARERDRLQLAISGARGVPALADGGLLVDELSKAIPEEDRDRVLGEMLIEA